MKIKQIQKYIYKGKEYKSLKEIKEQIHNTIGLEFLDQVQRICPLEKHKDYEKLLNLICKPEIRELLTECLNVTFEKIEHFEDTEESETINILDLKS